MRAPRAEHQRWITLITESRFCVPKLATCEWLISEMPVLHQFTWNWYTSDYIEYTSKLVIILFIVIYISVYQCQWIVIPLEFSPKNQVPVCCWRSPWPCGFACLRCAEHGAHAPSCATSATHAARNAQGDPTGLGMSLFFAGKKQWISYIYGSKNRICPTFRDFWMFFGCSFFASDKTRCSQTPPMISHDCVELRAFPPQMGSGNGVYTLKLPKNGGFCWKILPIYG